MQYFWLTCKHKWFVLLAGLQLGCPLWRLLAHDLSKFLPCELPHYQRQFFGNTHYPEEFAAAWLHHQNHNDHHWEYWISRSTHNGKAGDKVLDMSHGAILEMMADWMGAGRTYNGKWPDRANSEWLNKNASRICVSVKTAKEINEIVGYRVF